MEFREVDLKRENQQEKICLVYLNRFLIIIERRRDETLYTMRDVISKLTFVGETPDEIIKVKKMLINKANLFYRYVK